ncbi:endonuclease/exonuclease/phosphatase family protein [Ferruginibacter profundus]
MSPKLKKIARYCFITANIIILALYVTTCLVPFASGGKYPYIALTGLLFPLLFFALLGFLVYWAVRRSTWVFVCLAALLLGWQQVAVMFSFHFAPGFTTAKTPGTLRVFTWNLSSWGETNRANNGDNMAEMVQLVKNADADVVCFQELLYYKNRHYRDSVIPALKEAGYQYTYFEKVNYTGRLYTTSTLIGIEIMSKYPITGTGKFLYNPQDSVEPLIYADIKVDTQTIRVFTTHLQSVSFGQNEYDALYKLKEPAQASVTGSKAVIWKLKHAYKKRTVQADMLHEKISESPYPVIVCGDFNDVPNSYTYFTVKGNLQDAFLKKGMGIGRTFRFISPTLRIDYILADKKFDVLQYHLFKVPYSDHYPAVADFAIGEKK